MKEFESGRVYEIADCRLPIADCRPNVGFALPIADQEKRDSIHVGRGASQRAAKQIRQDAEFYRLEACSTLNRLCAPGHSRQAVFGNVRAARQVGPDDSAMCRDTFGLMVLCGGREGKETVGSANPTN